MICCPETLEHDTNQKSVFLLLAVAWPRFPYFNISAAKCRNSQTSWDKDHEQHHIGCQNSYKEVWVWGAFGILEFEMRGCGPAWPAPWRLWTLWAGAGLSASWGLSFLSHHMRTLKHSIPGCFLALEFRWPWNTGNLSACQFQPYCWIGVKW